MSLLVGAGCQQSSPAPTTSGVSSSTAPAGSASEAPSASSVPDGGGDAAPCSTSSPTGIAVSARTEVQTGVRYPILGAPLSVCVEQTGFPRGEDRHHRLFVSFLLEAGGERMRFTPRPEERVVWRGYTIFFGMARPSHTAPGVWIRVEREPAATP